MRKLLTAFCVVLAASRLACADERLVVNGGFEEGTTGWADFWSRGGGGQAALDTTSPHSGDAAIRVLHSGQQDWSLAQTGRLTVQPGDLFELTAWLKLTGEGTATLIRDFLREAFKATPLSRIAALLALTSLRRLTKRIDPRRVNGGVFLGLNGTVVKSHGSADATGVSAALKLAFKLAASGFNERLAARVASLETASQDGERVEAEGRPDT